ncbi:MAG: hypothetical protein F6J90_07460 [Moorea sp. SIOASIH]|uniref:hypothetical protein n=1 Tax=Moorena sp. SIOASIH TaxID=2607817 RepID=UPI0013B95A95|nr:hypothetical protein [Moorena sp. SIOASIH]NEO36170.1 hypothetical protein [Moorena sp. SIOASIH]
MAIGYWLIPAPKSLLRSPYSLLPTPQLPYSLLPTPYYSLLLPTTPYSLLLPTTPYYSLLPSSPTPYSLLPTPYSLLPTPCSLCHNNDRQQRGSHEHQRSCVFG